MFRANNVSIVLAQIANTFFPILVFPMIVRRIGLENYGLFNYTNLVYGLFCTVIDFNFNTFGVIYVSKYRNLVPLFSKLMLSVAVSMIFLAFCCITIPNIPVISLYWVALSIVLWGFNSSFAIIGVERGEYILFANVFSRIVLLLGIYFWTYDLNWAIIMTSISNIILSLLTFLIYLPFVKNKVRPSVAEIFAFLRQDYYAALVQFSGFLAGNLHLFLAKMLLGAVDYGTLSLLDRVFRSLISIFSAFSNSLLPNSSIFHSKYGLKKVCLYVICLSFSFVLLSISLPYILDILRFKIGQYRLVLNANYFKMIIWSLLAIISSFLGIIMLQARNESRIYFIGYSIAIVIELVITFLLRHLYSFNTAFYIMIITELSIFLCVVLGSFWLVKKES